MKIRCQIIAGSVGLGWGLSVCIKKVVGRMLAFLEEQGSHATHFTLLFDKYLKVLVDDGDSQQDTGPRADGSEEVSHYRQTTNT